MGHRAHCHHRQTVLEGEGEDMSKEIMLCPRLDGTFIPLKPGPPQSFTNTTHRIRDCSFLSFYGLN